MATRPSKAVLDYQVRQAARKEVEKQTERIKLECEKAIAQNYHRLWVIALRDEFGFGKVWIWERQAKKSIRESN